MEREKTLDFYDIREHNGPHTVQLVFKLNLMNKYKLPLLMDQKIMIFESKLLKVNLNVSNDAKNNL